jgi:hypothetical protein
MGEVTKVPSQAYYFLLLHAFFTPAFSYIRTLSAW